MDYYELRSLNEKVGHYKAKDNHANINRTPP